MPLEEIPMFSVQCLLLGLQGYLIPFATLAFISHCQNCTRKVPSLSLVCKGSTHFTSTLYISLRLPVSSYTVSPARLVLKI